MTDFDSILNARIVELDGSMPDPRRPSLVRRSRRAARPGKMALLLAASVSVLSIGALVAVAGSRLLDPAAASKNEADELRVRDDLSRYTSATCLGRDEAATLFRKRLDMLGLPSWSIRVDDRTIQAPCVSGTAIGDTQEVILTPSMGPKVGPAIAAVEAQLLGECLGAARATELVRGALAGAGVAQPNVAETVLGQYPADQADAYIAHVTGGCYVYAGAQFDSVGRYTWFVSGELAGSP